MRELKADDLASGLHYPCHLPKSPVEVRYVPYAEADGCAMERIIIEGYVLGVALHEADVLQVPAVNALLLAVFKHLAVYVEDDDIAGFADPVCHE